MPCIWGSLTTFKVPHIDHQACLVEGAPVFILSVEEDENEQQSFPSIHIA